MTFLALQAQCEGNPPTGHTWPVMLSFDVSVGLCKLSNKQSGCQWFDKLMWRHYNDLPAFLYVMLFFFPQEDGNLPVRRHPVVLPCLVSLHLVSLGAWRNPAVDCQTKASREIAVLAPHPPQPQPHHRKHAWLTVVPPCGHSLVPHRMFPHLHCFSLPIRTCAVCRIRHHFGRAFFRG